MDINLYQEMSEEDIIVKGEYHHSRSDLEHERDLLLEEDISSVILEGSNPDRKNEYSGLGLIIGWLISAFGFVMSPLYQSKDLILDLAEYEEVNLEYTRENDASLFRNASMFFQLSSILLFYFTYILALAIGIYGGKPFVGALVLFISILGPILLLRISNMRANHKENRDKIMANLIEEEAEDATGKVLAIVGDSHTDGVIENISAGFETSYRETEASYRDFEFIKNTAGGMLKAYGATLSVYLVLLFLTRFVVNIVPGLSL